MDDSRTLFVGNLGPNVTEPLLRELFLQAGPIEKVRLARVNGVPKPFAHIIYHHECSVNYATDIFKGTKLHKRELLLQQNNASRDSGQNYFSQQNNLREGRRELPFYGNQFPGVRNNGFPRGNSSRDQRRTPPPRGNRRRDNPASEDIHEDSRNNNFQGRNSRGNRYQEDSPRSSPRDTRIDSIQERNPRGNRYQEDSPRSSPRQTRNNSFQERISRGNRYQEDSPMSSPRETRNDSFQERNSQGNRYQEDSLPSPPRETWNDSLQERNPRGNRYQEDSSRSPPRRTRFRGDRAMSPLPDNFYRDRNSPSRIDQYHEDSSPQGRSNFRSHGNHFRGERNDRQGHHRNRLDRSPHREERRERSQHGFQQRSERNERNNRSSHGHRFR